MAAPDSLDQGAFEQQCLDGIHAWVREHLGGTVLDVQRLERWRPQWKVRYEAAGVEHAVLFRGDRPIAGKHDLRFEMDVMQVLEANGIKVPHIHGWVDTPKAFVMDWVETEDRAPGMLHTAIENPSTLSDERWQAMLGYMEHLAALHAVPVSAFSHIRRLSNPPSTPREIALAAPENMYAYAQRAGEVDTTFQFLQMWLRRNVPEHRTEARFIAGDAGQFMSAGTEVLALLDFEIANIGDTHWDLACFRGRHPYENMGDIPALYRRYAEVTGEPVDLRVVGYHTVGFLQLSGIAAKFFMLPEVRGANWIEGMLEVASISRRAYEAVAELEAIPLAYDLQLPEQPVIKPWEDSGLRKLMADIERLPTSTAFEPWERDLLHAIPAFLLNHARYRDWFEAETVADITALTGEPYHNLIEADAALSRLIDANDAAMDADLVPMMHRRTLRLSMIIAGTSYDAGNPLFHKLDPILG
ncbi:MAG: phosphotransferase [Halieaceae bacterium]|nr:phosphotransferase [Halieaceae bacterium]